MPPASLGTDFDAFVQGEVREGRYATPEDVLRAGLSLLRTQDPHLRALLAAIEEGEASGYDEDFDPEAFRQAMRERHGVSR